jgi:hypothetical protein
MPCGSNAEGGGSGDKHMTTVGAVQDRQWPGRGEIGRRTSCAQSAQKAGEGAADEWVRGHCKFK